MLCVRLISFSLAALLAAIALRSAGADEPNAPQVIELNVPAAAEPQPALRYRLTPSAFERNAGNAASFYYRAMLALKSQSADHAKLYEQKYEAWLAAPLDKFPKEEVRKWLAVGPVFSELRTAVYREHCDWDLRVQDLRGRDTIYLLLEDAQQCRAIARHLQLKFRLELSEGRYDDALETLRHGYQLGQDVAKTPLLINGLIGIAITSMMNGELLKLIEVSGANYYWALAALPAPTIDMRPALEFEMHMPLRIFPFLNDAETVNRSPEEWQRLIADCLRLLPDLSGSNAAQQPQWQDQLAVAGLMIKIYPTSKERLIADGLPRDKVEAMPVGQVVAIHTARSLRHAYDELFKLNYLPTIDATQRFPTAMTSLQDAGLLRSPLSGQEGLPLASLLLPAMSSVHQAGVRLERERAAFQAVEALRMHAAGSGQWPSSLAEVTVVPVPNNPATGQPFPYRFDAAKGEATLDVPGSDAQNSRRDAKRLVLRLRK